MLVRGRRVEGGVSLPSNTWEKGRNRQVRHFVHKKTKKPS